MLLANALADSNRFLGIEWHWWKVLGWVGNALFFSRFIVQWIATEKRKQVVIPVTFWWLSLLGSLVLLLYGIFHLRDSVVIFAYAFTWVPYIRNIVIHRRTKAAQRRCTACATPSLPQASFCHQCGQRLPDLEQCKR